MKCSYCGAPIEEGRVFCLNCGEEIEWVPEYNAIGSYRPNSVNAASEPMQPSKEEAKEPEPEQQRSKKKKKSPLIVGCVLLIIGICGLLGFKYYMDQKNYNSFDYQVNMAETEYSNRGYDKAYEYIERALSLEPDNADAMLLKSNILLVQEKTEEALAVLLTLIDTHPDNVTAYGRIIRIYELQERSDKIKSLLASVTDERVLNKYESYITEKPVLSLPSGEYNDILNIELYSPESGNNKIFYTTNGSTPTAESNQYFSGIKIGEGTTHLKAIVVSEKGISSEVSEATYKVKLLPPQPPKISPSSGDFTDEEDTKIYIIVSDGCVAYYAYDEIPTEASTKYMGPIEMPKGQHTFYAILVDKNGKKSEPSSADYNLQSESPES